MRTRYDLSLSEVHLCCWILGTGSWVLGGSTKNTKFTEQHPEPPSVFCCNFRLDSILEACFCSPCAQNPESRPFLPGNPALNRRFVEGCSAFCRRVFGSRFVLPFDVLLAVLFRRVPPGRPLISSRLPWIWRRLRRLPCMLWTRIRTPSGSLWTRKTDPALRSWFPGRDRPESRLLIGRPGGCPCGSTVRPYSEQRRTSSASSSSLPVLAFVLHWNPWTVLADRGSNPKGAETKGRTGQGRSHGPQRCGGAAGSFLSGLFPVHQI